jgi:hypothetical protein
MRAMRMALSVAALGSLLALGQPAPPSIERSTLRLHYVQKPIMERIQNIRTVRWTIIDGRVYDAQALWRSVRFQP